MGKKGLSIEALKLLACITMLLDHIGATVYPWLPLRIIGRVAFPLFAFALCQGFYHTRNWKKYLLRMGICALLTEPFFDLLFYGALTASAQNVLVTFFLGLLMATLMEKIPNPLGKVAVVLPFYLLAEFLRTDYAGAGILTVALFLLSYNKRGKLLLQGVGLLLIQLWMNSFPVKLFGIAVPIQLFALEAMIPIALYSGRKCSRSRFVQWTFYLFYPAHIALLLLFIKISGKLL